VPDSDLAVVTHYQQVIALRQGGQGVCVGRLEVEGADAVGDVVVVFLPEQVDRLRLPQ
jgi:hypothetical protein